MSRYEERGSGDAAPPLLGPVLAQRSAELTLAAAAAHPPGTLVRRDTKGVDPRRSTER